MRSKLFLFFLLKSNQRNEKAEGNVNLLLMLRLLLVAVGQMAQTIYIIPAIADMAQALNVGKAPSKA